MTSFMQRRLRQRLNRPFADRLQRRTVRRSLVVLGALWLVVMGFFLARMDDRIWLLALVDIPFLILAALLVLSVHGIFELADEQLDEYQIGVRNAAYKTAYGYNLIFLLIVAVTLTGLSLDRMHAYSVAFMAFLAAALAPRAIAAWNLQDNLRDET